MNTLLRLVQSADVSTYYWLSQFHGQWALDHLAFVIQANALFQCAPFIAMYWYFWFNQEGKQSERRNAILTILIGSLISLVIARTIAAFTPFRVRPIYNANLLHHPLSVVVSSGLVDWSSFPSDHAVYLAALGTGLVKLSRRLMAPVIFYVAMFICMPRVYLGIHYLSDVVVGVGIGVFIVLTMLYLEAVPKVVTRRLLGYMEINPHVFYGMAFLVLFEMASLFDDVREPARALFHLIFTHGHHKVFEISALLFLFLCVTTIVYLGTICSIVVKQHVVGDWNTYHLHISKRFKTIS